MTYSLSWGNYGVDLIDVLFKEQAFSIKETNALTFWLFPFVEGRVRKKLLGVVTVEVEAVFVEDGIARVVSAKLRGLRSWPLLDEVADPNAITPLPGFEDDVGCTGGRSARLLPSVTGGRFAYKK